jgi:transcriptional regulator with XRE-family HTH domain
MPNVNEAAKAWELGLSGRVGKAVRARRDELGLTAGQLHELTAATGYPVHRVAITKIENNTRAGKLDIAELLALATALKIPPLELLFGGPPGDTTAYLPTVSTSTLDAVTRFTGDLPRRQVGAISVQLEAIKVAIAPLAGRGDLISAAEKVEETK